MKSKLRVLVAEDDPSLREAIVDTLEIANLEVEAVADGNQALQVLQSRNDIGIVVSDVNMPNLDGYELLKISKERFPHIPVVLMTAYGTIHQSVKAMQEGAVDYLVKPFEPALLQELVQRYTGGISEEFKNAPVAVANSSLQLLELAKRVAKSDSTALILGESGTGKEVLARYVHDCSNRSQGPFVAINCAAIPETMLESILFGHEKGAFTGATASMPGKFEQANGGTILLDEISEMDMALQAKLLRVLQEREVERLGGRKTIRLDVRVIATSNRTMLDEVKAGRFREDLYYRLSVLPLFWLPLRERRDDIVPLAEKLLRKHARKQHRNGVRLSIDAKQGLINYSWPGNVRELDNVIQRALILQEGLTINACDLGLPNEKGVAMALPVISALSCSDASSNALPSTTVNSSAPEVMTTSITIPKTNLSENTNCFRANVSGSRENVFESWMQNETTVAHSQPQSLTSLWHDDQNSSLSAPSTPTVRYSPVSELFSEANLDTVDTVKTPPATPDMGKGSLGNDLKQREFELIVDTIRDERGSRKRAAARLGISPRTLRYKIAKFREVGLIVEEQL